MKLSIECLVDKIRDGDSSSCPVLHQEGLHKFTSFGGYLLLNPHL